MENEPEIWKDVKDYEGLYQISHIGNVKSLRFNKLLDGHIETVGYKCYSLTQNGITVIKKAHILVAIAFHGHVPCGYKRVINHIDFNKLNNHYLNLEITTQRQNSNRKHLKSSSIYTGVAWAKHTNKWHSIIRVNKKTVHLGYFDNEKEASDYYEAALLSINNGTEIIVKPTNYSSKYKGVMWYKRSKRWCSYVINNKKRKHLGYFDTELEAYNATLQEINQ